MRTGVSSVTDVTGVTGQERKQHERGYVLLNDIEDFLSQYISYPSEHALVAHVLWIAHAHVMDIWDSTPRLAFLSTEPGSGKTAALEVTGLLVPRPWRILSASPASLFRRIAASSELPTILFDEVDTIFGSNPRANEDIRAVLNAGHGKGAVVPRCVERGKNYGVTDHPVYCAVAMAGLGDLPKTILSRSVAIRMRPPLQEERVEPFRRRNAEAAGKALQDRLQAWGPCLQALVAWNDPISIPPDIKGRDADVWEPLLAVADAAEGRWPARARAAASAMVAEAKERTPSLGIQLLADLRRVFGDRDKMSTSQIVTALQQLSDAPWADLDGGRGLNGRRLVTLLKAYDIKPKSVRLGADVQKGLTREDLADTWARYLQANTPQCGPSNTSPDGAVTNVTADTAATDAVQTGNGAARIDVSELIVFDDPEEAIF